MDLRKRVGEENEAGAAIAEGGGDGDGVDQAVFVIGFEAIAAEFLFEKNGVVMVGHDAEGMDGPVGGEIPARAVPDADE